jgi:phosphocarrier protein HPr
MEITEKITITNRLGLHLRAAAELAKTSSKFRCEILFKNRHHQADGKSVINLLALAATKGAELTVTFQGEDARDARSAIQRFFSSNFGEKE